MDNDAMVERVARAIDGAPFEPLAQASAALQASHHAELVEALRQAVKTNPQEHWIELLTKIGEGQ